MTQEFFDGMQTEGEKMVAKQMRDAERRKRARLLKQVNDALYKLGHNVYHDSVPLGLVDEILSHAEFDPLPEMILCGREGRLHEPVGHNRWLTLTWYKMESGRYEVIAYVS